MAKRLSKFLPIKAGEGPITALMFAYIFGVLFFYYVLDPLRKGLFLKSFPSSQLPYAYFLTAICAGTIATLTFKLSRRASAITLVTGINLAIIGTLFYFRWAMGRELWYLPWIYFVYVKIVSVLSTAQFWLLAGYIYDQRQAKRIYSLLGTGAIVGATAGSFVPAFLSSRLSTESMLMICIGVCALLILLSHIAWRYRLPDGEAKPKSGIKEEPKEKFSDLWPMIFGSKHLRMMVLLIFLTLIASQIADWQIDDAAQRAFQDQPQEKISEFFGRFSLITNILAMGVQVLLTNFLINRQGIFAAIVFLPASLFFSSLAVFLYPTLLTATLARGSDTVSRYSLNRPGLEMLYLPLAPAIRKRLKIFVDVFVDRTGRAVAGIVILVMTTSYFPFGQRGTAAVAMVLTLMCVLACIQLRKTYVNAFRLLLTRREVELEDVSHYVTDPTGVQLLVNALQGANERQILYSFKLLQSARDFDFSAQLFPLLRHPSAHIREEALRTLPALPQDCTAEALGLLEDPNPGVRHAAIEYLCSHDPAASPRHLDSLLKHDRMEIRLGAARWAAAHADATFQPSIEFVQGLVAIEEPYGAEARAVAAGLTSRLTSKDAENLLRQLIEDPVPSVVAAAASAAGRAGHQKLVLSVVNMLSVRQLRSSGREALLLYGERVVGTLGDLLSDKDYDLALRREIPWVLARISGKRSMDLLADNLDAEDALLRYRIVKALNRLHESNSGLSIPPGSIEDRLIRETHAYYEALSIRKAIEADGNNGQKGLLARALRERLDQRLEIIFRMLGLQHPQKDVYFAFRALKEKGADRRSAAIEFMDNLLQRSLKPIILPLLEESSMDALLDRAKTLGIQFAAREDALRRLLAMPDVWLKTCALHEIGEKQIRELAGDCRAFTTDADPVIQETATWALARCG